MAAIHSLLPSVFLAGTVPLRTHAPQDVVQSFSLIDADADAVMGSFDYYC